MKVVSLLVVLALAVVGITGAKLGFVADAQASPAAQEARAPQAHGQSVKASEQGCAQAASGLELEPLQMGPSACYTQYMCISGAIYNSRASCVASCSGSCFIYAQCCNGRCIPY